MLLDVFEERGIVKIIISDDGQSPRRLFSPAGSKLALLQNENRLRRESFDSVTGYVTPSISSLNTGSPLIQSKQNPLYLENLSERGEPSTSTRLTEDALQKMELEHSRMSPELGHSVPSVTQEPAPSSPQRKRKRSIGMEVPASPDKTRHPPEKKRATGIKAKASTVEAPASQTSRVPETPPKERAQTPLLAIISENPNPEENKSNEMKELKKRRGSGVPNDPIELDSASDVTGVKESNKAPKAKARRNNQNKKTEMEKEAPTKDPTAGDEAGNKKTAPPRRVRKPATKETKKSPSVEEEPAKRAVANENPKPRVDEKSTKATSDTKAVISRTKKNVKESSDTATSSTSETSSSSDASESSQGSSSTSSPTSSANEDSESEQSLSEKASKRSDSPKVEQAKKKSGKQGDLDGSVKPNVPATVGKDVSRSASPASSHSSSSSDKSSDSSSESTSDSNSASDSEDSGSGSQVSNKSADDSASETSDSESASDSDDSRSSSSSSSAKSCVRSRSASPISNANSAKSSSHDESSNSSRMVAISLGGHPSTQKSVAVDPILHRTLLSQETDRSLNDTTLSQQSPLTSFSARENSKLKRWNSLSELAKKMREEPNKNLATKRKQAVESDKESGSESESDSDSSDDDSDASEKEDTGGIPKDKLAGRAPVTKKRKSGGLRSMFK